TAFTAADQVLIVNAPGVLANDADVDPGDSRTVAAVNGQVSAVAATLTLASGAFLTVQANGSYRYDPHGKFDALSAGQTATDSFTYTLADAAGATSSATVTIVIQGVTVIPSANGSIAGSVYVDVNNDGLRGSQ